MKRINNNELKDKYAGWDNYETWNVMLWINNSDEIYFSLLYLLDNCSYVPNYKEVIHRLGLDECITKDGVLYLDKKLNYKELNIAIAEIRKLL